ncbi:hypothetical protein JQX13_49290 [Archangium violaceum]|uniref:hypothetical protein n=1 Tax=Archangium violaceum TaxID=83451 RepID=UPI00193B4AE1|nr:hypothetical protein [Archangium violaceum]QRK07885.1 hypothetical protein JQX13_49290 [Archangium violaceum]
MRATLRSAMRAVLLALMFLLPALASATDVQGTLSGHTVWKRSGSPYVLKGDVTVAWGARLTLEPGVQVIAASEDALGSGVDPRRVELIVDGTLVVRGTAAHPVELSSRGGEGSWYGIRVRGGRGTEIHGAVITRAAQGISLGMSAVVRNTSVSATTRDCLQVLWGSATLEGNELSQCGARESSVRVRVAENHSPAQTKQAHRSEPSVRGRRVFMTFERGTRGGALASRATAREHTAGTRVATFRATGVAIEQALGRRAWGRPRLPVERPGTPPPGGTSPPLALDSREECAREPRVLESPECPGVRRWREKQERLGEERLGEAPPGVLRPHAPTALRPPLADVGPPDPGWAGERSLAPDRVAQSASVGSQLRDSRRSTPGVPASVGPGPYT